MRFTIRQRVFSWFDNFDIYDEEGNTAFTVKGKLSWGITYISLLQKEKTSLTLRKLF